MFNTLTRFFLIHGIIMIITLLKNIVTSNNKFNCNIAISMFEFIRTIHLNAKLFY